MLSLPNDALFIIFSYCDNVTLGILSQVCKRFRDLASSDSLWINQSRNCLVTNQVTPGIKSRSCHLLAAKEKCRISLNWRQGDGFHTQLVKHRTRYMPWLQLKENRLWLSEGSNLKAYPHKDSGRFPFNRPLLSLRSQHGDVCRFAINNDVIVSAESDGSVQGWAENSGHPLFIAQECHFEEVSAIDLRSDIMLTGSRDKSLKLWNMTTRPIEKLQVKLTDRVWSVAVSPSLDSFVCGTGGCNGEPLLLYDSARGTLLTSLGSNYILGAGVLHCMYENPQCIISGGYDTYIRLWDTRCQMCVMQLENPFDLAVYCLSSDQNFTLLSGSSSHGLVWLWDKRFRKPVQHYYIGTKNSPVYSLTFDPCHMFVALDSSLHLQDFSRRSSKN